MLFIGKQISFPFSLRILLIQYRNICPQSAPLLSVLYARIDKKTGVLVLGRYQYPLELLEHSELRELLCD
jgi:hypothetical protein